MRRWVVDAWNVVGSRPDGWWRDRPGALARLLDEIIRWRAEVGEPAVVVVDGPQSPAGPAPGEWYGVDTRYTGTSGRDAGDDHIVELLTAEPTLDPRRDEIVVVTSDRRLGERVGALGAHTEGAAAFRRRLADIESRRRDREVLATMGADESALLGRGGEARVFALGDDRVLRLPHPGTNDEAVDERAALIRSIGERAASVDLPFALPEVLEVRDVDDRRIAIERRLPGRPAVATLADQRTDRAALIRSSLDAAAAIASIAGAGPLFGDVSHTATGGHDSFRAWSIKRLTRSLADAGHAFSHVDAADLTDELIAALPADAAGSAPVLVHLDACLANMLAEGDRISAVLDFGPTTIDGIPRLDPLTAIAYLAPEITPGATADDVAVATAWAAERGLDAAAAPAERWAAAYWAWASDDERLHAWCRRVLGA